MTTSQHQSVPAEGSLWQLAAAPLMWAGHLMLSYCTGAIWCAKFPGGDFVVVRLAIAAYTALALAAIAVVGIAGYRKHRLGGASAPHDDDSPEDRQRFLGFATLLLAGLSAIAVAYAGLVGVFVRRCH
jgi:hypothetical protein